MNRRHPLNRYVRLSPGSSRLKRSKLKPASKKRRAQMASLAAIKRTLIQIRGDRCEWPGCTNRAQDPHHLLKRSQGGDDSPENLKLVCRFHHDAIHADETAAVKAGWLIRRSGKTFNTKNDWRTSK